MESPLSLLRTHWDHELLSIASFISNELRVRFMESPLSFLRMHWDHEPDRAGATSAASRSVTAEYYDAPGFGLLVGEIGSG